MSFLLVVAAACSAAATAAHGYPLDGAERTGIRRLLGYSAAQRSSSGPKLPAGALLGSDGIEISRLGDGESWDLADANRDAGLQAAIDALFAKRDPSYSVIVIDVTDPQSIVWAGRRERSRQSPGSVGKILCMVALFDGLRRAFPDPGDRERILRETMVTGGSWVLVDEHKVPKYDAATATNRFAIVAAEDRFSLSEWTDHMISASANAAGAVVWREAMLLRAFGADYPPSAEQRTAFFRETPKAELTLLSQRVIDEPLEAAAIETSEIQQGSMWTRTGKQIVPGLPSYATPRELARIILRIEQGRMVDAWSSLEMKRYLYMTKRRYRYVFAPELARAAVYFKSGSLYQCVAQEGFRCGKYMGNAKNYMNSVVMVETPAAATSEGPRHRYIVALMSNVLRINSAWDHSRLGAAIDEAVRTRKPPSVREHAGEKELDEVGRSD